MRRTLLILALLFPMAQAAKAAAPTPGSLTAQDADRLAGEAAALRTSADSALAGEKTECYRRFFVNSCLADADARHLKAREKARELDLQADRIRRALKAEELRAQTAGLPSEEALKAEGERRRQAQQEQLRAAQQQSSAEKQGKEERLARQKQQAGQLGRHRATQGQQAARTSEARRRVEDARRQTEAYKAAQEASRKRAEAAAKAAASAQSH